MKFTLEWLKVHLDTSGSLTEIVKALTDMGLEVESVRDPGEQYERFSVCQVLSAHQHPNADRLKVCQVEFWPRGPSSPSETLQVVCGAPNARTGLVGIFAPVGSHIPGTGLDLKKGMIRGEESNGMLCSESELMLSDESDGIIELPEDTQLGSRFTDVFPINDPVIEIAVTPNRPDALGIRGIARDLAARGLGTLKPLEVSRIKGQFQSPIGVVIDEELKVRGCPMFMGLVIRNIKNGPSPVWLQNRLKAIDLRPISALVDVTNYITYEYGRPLHVFDADKIKGNFRIHRAQGGETITALDGEEYALEQDMMVISDDQGPASIAGVMGGEYFGCTDDTTTVFLESALWDPITIAETGRKLKVNSDARYRFERGVDPNFTEAGLKIAANMIVDLCGGEISEIVYDGEVPDTSRSLTLSTAHVERLIGMDVSAERQVEILEALGFAPKFKDSWITVRVPSWRPDIGHDSVDLVEEIARIASLTNLVSHPMPRPDPGVSRSSLTPMQRREQTVRRLLAGLGYNECVNYSFVDRKSASLFAGDRSLVQLDNPISSEMDVMRPDLIPGLLKAVVKNQARGHDDLSLFEIGPTFLGTEPGEQNIQACGIMVGSLNSLSPHSQSRGVDIYDAKADLERILNAIGRKTRFRIRRLERHGWHSERTGGIFLRPGKPLGWFGQIHPKVSRTCKVNGPMVGFALLLDEIPFARNTQISREPMQASDLQSIERDFSFIVDTKVEAQAILQAVGGSKFRDRIASVDLFDEFTGEQAETQFAEGKKSLTFRIKFYPDSVQDNESLISGLSADIEQRVHKATNGTLRRL